MTVRVKICGLTRKIDVEAAIHSGTDALGFVFGYKDSPRNLSFKKLESLLSFVPPFVSTVVVSPASNPQLERVVELRPSFFQLFEDSTGTNRNLDNVIQTVRPTLEKQSIIEKSALLSKSSKAILFDASKTSRYSSEDGSSQSGLKQNLATARKIKRAINKLPLIYSGGLNSENVEHVVRTVRPFAVDVSSGVEKSAGIKDEKKIASFIRAAKNVICNDTE